MDSVKLSQISKTNFTNKQETKEVAQEAPKQKKNGKKLLAAGAIAAATAAVAGLAIYKGKAKSLSDIDFNKGIATLKKNGKNYSGKIKTNLPNGDKLTMEYLDGILQKSTRIGEKNVSKTFSVNNKGEKIVEIIKDGKTEIKNISETIEAVKRDQNKIKELLNNKTMSIAEFESKCKELKYTNRFRRSDLDDVYGEKYRARAKEVRKEANRREVQEYKAEMHQEKINRSLEENLSHKSAKESAESMQKAWIQKEAEEKALAQEATKETLERAQKVQDEYFEVLNTPSKSAKESAEAIMDIEQEKLRLQEEELRKPFEEKLSHKSARESAETIMNIDFQERAKVPFLENNDFYSDLAAAQNHGVKFNPEKYGFSAQGKPHYFNGETLIIHEGPGLFDVTSDGRLLEKVPVSSYEIRNANSSIEPYKYFERPIQFSLEDLENSLLEQTKELESIFA